MWNSRERNLKDNEGKGEERIDGLDVRKNRE
jgi:hypothetical protein